MGGASQTWSDAWNAHEQNWQRAKGFLAAASVALALLEVAVEAWFRK